MSIDIAAAIEAVQNDIRHFETAYERPHGSVTLLAVSKTKPLADIVTAIAAGQLEFGENYVDEGVEKIETLQQHPVQASLTAPLIWHFIGAIQSRKTRQIAEHFDWVHSVDREKVASRLNEQRPTALPPLNICLQVNLDSEDTKAGVPLDAVEPLLAHCHGLPRLKVRGLMSIPAPHPDFDSQRAGFARLRSAFDALSSRYPGLDTLSMGMTADMEAAIAEHATMVRVGTALFGRRN